MSAKLKWTKVPETATSSGVEHWDARCGDLIIGTIGRRADGSCWYRVQSIGGPWIGPCYGNVGSRSSARRSIERAWETFLRLTRLEETDARLRQFALSLINRYDVSFPGFHRALEALHVPDEAAWKPWKDVRGSGVGIWYHFRDPDDDTRDVDRVDFNQAGEIVGKYGCGLDFYRECQPCRFDDDVAAALAAAYERSEEASTGQCDWCKQAVTTLADRRDYDEGMWGPVYRVCKSCRDRHDQRIAEEMDSDSLGDDW